jgi:hypothetical protein
VVNDAAAAEVPADAVQEGGDTPAARRGTFLDLALCLAGGLNDAGLATLFKTAALGLPVGSLQLLTKARTSAATCTLWAKVSLALTPSQECPVLSTIRTAWQDKDSGVQKKSYKVVAYLCESRPDFIRAHLQVCCYHVFNCNHQIGFWYIAA